MGGADDLTGRWEGVYFYPVDADVNPLDDLPPTPFTAVIEDRGGEIHGQTSEPDLSGGPANDNGEILAVIEGHRLAAALFFTKFPRGRQTHTIDYQGIISGDGNSISGQWIIHGEWSGTFQMQRRLTSAEKSSSQAVEAQT